MGNSNSKQSELEESTVADNDKVIEVEEEEEEDFNDPIARIMFLLKKDSPDVDEIKALINNDDGETKIDLNTPDLPPVIPEDANMKDPHIIKLMDRIAKRTYLGDYPMHLLVGRSPKFNTPELVSLVKLFFLKDHLMNCRNKLGSTPLHRACAAGNADMVKELLAWGAQVDAVNDMQLSCLHMACYAGHADVVRVLLDNGASKHIHFKCLYGIAPADYVLKDDILQMLKDAKRANNPRTAEAEKKNEVANKIAAAPVIEEGEDKE